MKRSLPSCDQCTWFLVYDGEPLCEKIEEIPQSQFNWLMGKKYSHRPEICPLYLHMHTLEGDEGLDEED